MAVARPTHSSLGAVIEVCLRELPFTHLPEHYRRGTSASFTGYTIRCKLYCGAGVCNAPDHRQAVPGRLKGSIPVKRAHGVSPERVAGVVTFLRNANSHTTHYGRFQPRSGWRER